MERDYSLRSGERQVALCLRDIAACYVARYQWVLNTAPLRSIVLDLGCGCGYGSGMLADAGYTVYGLDASEEAVAYAARNWGRPNTTFAVQDLNSPELPVADVGVAFEVIEHLQTPEVLLRRIPAQTLYLSTPNAVVYPWRRGLKWHIRHWTLVELTEVLQVAGWRIVELYGQVHEGPLTRFDETVSTFIVLKAVRAGVGAERR